MRSIGLRAASLAAALLLGMPALAQKAAQTAELRYYCEDLPPSNYLENGQLKGVSVEILKLIWKSLGIAEQPIEVLPWARGYEMAQREKGTVLFSMSRTVAREAMFKWVGPIFTVRNVFLGLAGRDISIKDIEGAKRYAIGVVKDDVSELYLKERGFNGGSLQSVADLDLNFKKLQMGRIDLIAHSLDTFKKYISVHSLEPDRFKVYFEFSTSANYYAFNRETPDAVVASFQRALDGLGAERAEILKRYGSSP
jgi:polar amino acid transport system substrate-binding protein